MANPCRNNNITTITIIINNNNDNNNNNTNNIPDVDGTQGGKYRYVVPLQFLAQIVAPSFRQCNHAQTHLPVGLHSNRAEKLIQQLHVLRLGTSCMTGRDVHFMLNAYIVDNNRKHITRGANKPKSPCTIHACNSPHYNHSA